MHVCIEFMTSFRSQMVDVEAILPERNKELSSLFMLHNVAFTIPSTSLDITQCWHFRACPVTKLGSLEFFVGFEVFFLYKLSYYSLRHWPLDWKSFAWTLEGLQAGAVMVVLDMQ